MSGKTKYFDVNEINDCFVEEIINEVVQSLEEKGYNAINQIVGYIVSGDPGFISNHNESRSKLCSIDRTKLVEIILRNYVSNEILRT